MTLNKIRKPAIRSHSKTRSLRRGRLPAMLANYPNPDLFIFLHWHLFLFLLFCVSLPSAHKIRFLGVLLAWLDSFSAVQTGRRHRQRKIQVIVSASAAESKRLSRSRVEVTSKSRAKSNTLGPSSLSRMQTRVRHLRPSVFLNFVVFFLCRFGSGKVVGGVRNLVGEFRANNRVC